MKKRTSPDLDRVLVPEKCPLKKGSEYSSRGGGKAKVVQGGSCHPTSRAYGVTDKLWINR